MANDQKMRINMFFHPGEAGYDLCTAISNKKARARKLHNLLEKGLLYERIFEANVSGQFTIGVHAALPQNGHKTPVVTLQPPTPAEPVPEVVEAASETVPPGKYPTF